MSPNDATRRELMALSEALRLQNTKDHHLWRTDEPTAADLNKLNIRWEKLVLEDTRDISLRLSPPVFFRPLSQKILDAHPVEREPDFIEYAPWTKGAGSLEVPWTPSNCASWVEYYLSSWVSSFPRAGFPKKSRPGETWIRPDLAIDVGWHQISYPNPVLLDNGLGDCSVGRPAKTLHNRFAWQHIEQNGDLPKFSHVIASVCLDCDVHEDTITVVELMFLINAMKARACQPVVSDEEAELLYEGVLKGKDVQNRPLAFPEETRFPILVVSLAGPQHGRMLYACMDKGKMVILQSRLYSFEKKDTASLDLFARWLLSDPVSE